MDIKNIFSKIKNSFKVKNKAALKHGGYSLAITAIVLAVAVGVNVLFAVLSTRVNLDIDISLSGANTLDEENIKFLEELENEVKITVCLTEEDYQNGGMAQVGQSYYNAVDSTGSYFTQTVSLLNKYPVYSDKIKLEYVNPYDPSFTAVVQEYSTSNIMAGDIIVESFHIVDGKEVKRSNVLKFEDVYTLYDESGYAAMGYSTYSITENKLETALTSAIYKVTSAETKRAVVIGAHSDTAMLDGYLKLLQMNNFEVEKQETNVVVEFDKDTDLVILAAPYEDFLAEELELIDEWLYNSAIRGRGLIYFASATSPSLPTLENYLAEWGIGFEKGLLFETQEGMYVAGDPTTMAFLPPKETFEHDAANTLSEKISIMVASGGNVPMTRLFETEGIRQTFAIASTSEGVVKAPLGVKSDWTPGSSYERASHPGLILALEETYEENVLRTSYVAAFSSFDFAAEDWLTTYSYNTELLLSTARLLSGAEDEGLTFTSKKQTTNAFDEVVSQDDADTISLIFQWGLPILLIATGVVVFIRRRRK